MAKEKHRLYSDLAWLWPLWGGPGEYAAYCDNAIRLIEAHARRPVRTLLNLGCGGGKNAFNLKGRYAVTGLDLSPAMLDNARRLNPDCSFVRGDMRSFRLPMRFDAVLVEDAICYMTSEADLGSVFQCAYDALEPGGVMLVGPDDTTETFVQNESAVTPAATADKPADLDVVFVENDYDPDPTDSVYDALMIYIIRQNGKLRIEEDLHHLGLFPMETWRRLVREPGFEVREAVYTEEAKEYTEFICIKPA